MKAHPAINLAAAMFCQLHSELRKDDFKQWPESIKEFTGFVGGSPDKRNADAIRELSQLLDDLARATSALAEKRDLEGK